MHCFNYHSNDYSKKQNKTNNRQLIKTGYLKAINYSKHYLSSLQTFSKECKAFYKILLYEWNSDRL